jgi:hypothetical protein
LVRPRRFFENGIAPGDQAPGLTFAIAVAAAYVGGRLLLAPETLSGYGRIAGATGSAYLSAAIVLVAACFLVAPLVLHLAAAIGTLSLIPIAKNRGGVSETVQLIAYAAAPGVFAAVPFPTIQALAALYGCVLLVVGISVVHETPLPRAVLAASVPALFVFGFAFGGIGAFEAAAGIDITPDPR